MNRKRVLVIGGGMAGLSAGCYAQMNGYESHIFEKHEVAGGLCAAWTRNGYTFDISIHMLCCSRSGGMTRMWDELGVRQGRTLIDHEDGGVVEVDGALFTWHADLDKLRQEMLRFSDGDEAAIEELIESARLAATLDFWSEVPEPLWGLPEMAGFVAGHWRLILFARKWGKVSVTRFAERFHSPVLREVLRLCSESEAWSMPDWSMLVLLISLGMRHAQNSSYAIGGSFNVAQTIARRYLDLGGELHLRSLVDHIIVEGDRAVGVHLADGSEIRGDFVISAGDGRSAIWSLLQGRYLGETIAKNYREWTPCAPLVMVLMGVNRDMAGIPHSLSIQLERPVRIAGNDRQRMDVLITTFDPTLAPAGKACVQVWYTTPWEYWARLAGDRDRYEAEKESIARTVIAELDARWPGFGADVEVVDVPTPLTFRRYTLNEQGSPDGWCSTTRNGTGSMPVTLPGLSGFYMAGQWTMPFSGVPGAALSGRTAVQLICHEEKRRFETSLPPAGWGPATVRPKDKPETRHGTGRANAAVSAPVTRRPLTSVHVDPEKCQGCGDCEVACPEVFQMADDGRARVIVDSLWPEVEEAVLAALERCPDVAIVAS